MRDREISTKIIGADFPFLNGLRTKFKKINVFLGEGMKSNLYFCVTHFDLLLLSKKFDMEREIVLYIYRLYIYR